MKALNWENGREKESPDIQDEREALSLARWMRGRAGKRWVAD
jgi:hypothetical protein